MRITRTLMLAATLAALGACAKSEPDAPPPDNAVDVAPIDQPSPEAAPTPVETEAAAPVNTAEALPPPPPVAPDAQMMDDAAAVGMTARSDRSQPRTDRTSDAPTDEEAPVENAEQ